MQTIRNSEGVGYSIGLTLGDVRRLQAGVVIEEGRTLTEDFGHSDKDKLQEQLDRIMSLPLFAMELTYALLPTSVRSQVSFASFLGDGTSDEPWKPEDLLLATQALAEEVLLFFQGRIPVAALARRATTMIQKESRRVIAEFEAMPEEKILSLMQAISDAENGIAETIGGTTSIDSPGSPDSATLKDSASDSSAVVPPEPTSEPPSVPLPSVPLLGS